MKLPCQLAAPELTQGIARESAPSKPNQRTHEPATLVARTLRAFLQAYKQRRLDDDAAKNDNAAKPAKTQRRRRFRPSPKPRSAASAANICATTCAGSGRSRRDCCGLCFCAGRRWTANDRAAVHAIHRRRVLLNRLDLPARLNRLQFAGRRFSRHRVLELGWRAERLPSDCSTCTSCSRSAARFFDRLLICRCPRSGT